MKQFYTYVYIDPRNFTPIYVGKGCGKRAENIMAHTGNKQLIGYVKNMKKEGFTPIIEITNSENEKEAFIHEQLLIGMYGRKDLGQGPLFNHSDGGEGGATGYVHTEKTRQRVSKALSGIPKTKEHKEAISKSQMGKKQSQTSKEANRYAHIGNKNASGKRTEEQNRKNSQAQLAKPLVICPYCGKVGYSPTLYRWHFNNCKDKP